MNLEDNIKDIKKEISELKKAMFVLIKEIKEGFKMITEGITNAFKEAMKQSEQDHPMKDDYWRIFI